MPTFGYKMTFLVTKCTLQISYIKQLFLRQHNNTLHSTVKPALGQSGEQPWFFFFVQTLPDLNYIYVPKCPMQFGIDYTYRKMYVCKRGPSWNPNSGTVPRDRPQHDRSTARVIVQQYSSSTFLSLSSQSQKEKCGARLKVLCHIQIFQGLLKSEIA